jgi:hypothetical protein
MANVIRAQFQNQDGRLNIDKGVLTFYGGDKPVKWDITKRETTELLREFLSTAYSLGKLPSRGIVHKTPKNSFGWNVTTPFVERYNLQNEKHYTLLPGTKHTKDILSAMVRANVK